MGTRGTLEVFEGVDSVGPLDLRKVVGVDQLGIQASLRVWALRKAADLEVDRVEVHEVEGVPTMPWLRWDLPLNLRLGQKLMMLGVRLGLNWGTQGSVVAAAVVTAVGVVHK